MGISLLRSAFDLNHISRNILSSFGRIERVHAYGNPSTFFENEHGRHLKFEDRLKLQRLIKQQQRIQLQRDDESMDRHMKLLQKDTHLEPNIKPRRHIKKAQRPFKLMRHIKLQRPIKLLHHFQLLQRCWQRLYENHFVKIRSHK